MPKSEKTNQNKSSAKASAKKPKDAPKPRRAAKAIGSPLRIIGLILWPRFMRNAWGELKLVTWPGWKLSRQLTVAVIIFAAIFALIVGLVDWGFDKAFKTLFLR